MKSFFPLFVDMSGKKVLIIGGGAIAERRAEILAGFGADIMVISPNATENIEHAASAGNISLLKRKYTEGDIAELKPFLVIAATDQRQINQQVMTESKKLNILVSVADCREECTFYFPAIVENENYIAGLVSKNGNHEGVKEMAKDIRNLLKQVKT